MLSTLAQLAPQQNKSESGTGLVSPGASLNTDTAKKTEAEDREKNQQARREAGQRALKELPVLFSSTTGDIVRLSSLIGKKLIDEDTLKRKRPQKPQHVNVEIESDVEEQELHKVHDEKELSLDLAALYIDNIENRNLCKYDVGQLLYSDSEDSIDNGDSVVRIARARQENGYDLSAADEAIYHPLAQHQWESAIYWDDSEEEKQKEQNKVTIEELEDQEPEQAAEDDDEIMWEEEDVNNNKNDNPTTKPTVTNAADDLEDMEWDEEEAAEEQPQQVIVGVTPAPHAQNFQADLNANIWEFPKENTNIVEINKKTKEDENQQNQRSVYISKFPQNTDFATCKWLNTVIWDDRQLPKEKPNIRFIFDKNDLEMVADKVTLNRKKADDPRYKSMKQQQVVLTYKMEDNLDANAMKRLENIRKREQRMGNYIYSSGDDKDKDGEGMNVGTSRGWLRRIPKIRHSLPAMRLLYAKTDLLSVEARNFHRPKTPYEEREVVNIHVVNESIGGIKQSSGYTQTGQLKSWKKSDITGRDGPLILLEYSEKRPLMVSDVGMASVICNFYRRSVDPNADEGEEFETNFEGPKLPEGKTVILGAEDSSPFLANLKPDRIYQAIYNSMFIAPIFQHACPNTDFLLVRPSRSTRCSQPMMINGFTATSDYAYLREIKGLFCVGQVEPQREVFQPNSFAFIRSNYLRFQFDYMCYHVLRKLSKTSTPKLNIKNVHELFPTATEQIIKRVLKQIAVRDKNEHDKPTGFYLKKEGHEFSEYRSKIHCEDMCSYESVQAGLQRLYDVNIFRLTKDDVSRVMLALQAMEKLYKNKAASALALRIAVGDESVSANQKLSIKLSPEEQKELASARFVLEELQCTPWYLSSCYVNMHIKQGQANAKFTTGGMMRLKGVGDPSGRFEAFSFLPELQDESSRRKRGRRKKRFAQENMIHEETQKAQYGGTESDLRKLTNAELVQILRQLGYADSKIAKLSRWDRNYIIKKTASGKNGATMLGGLLAKFARQTTKVGETTAAEREFYQQRIDQIFERGCASLSSDVVDFTDDSNLIVDSDDEDSDDEFEKDLDAGLMAMTDGKDAKKSKEMDSHEEANELQKLTQMLAGDNSNNKVISAGSSSTKSPVAATASKTAASMLSASSDSKNKDRRVPAKMGWRPYDVLKRTIVETKPNGKTVVRVEYIKNPKKVRHFKNEELKKKAIRGETLDHLRSAAAGSVFGKDELAKSRRRKEKLKNEADLSAGQERYEWYMKNIREHGEKWPYSVEPDRPNAPRCSVCRLPGHNSQSSKCPLAYAKLEKNKAVRQKGGSGLKLSINRKHLGSKKRKFTGDVSDIYKKTRLDGKKKSGRRRLPSKAINLKFREYIKALYGFKEVNWFIKKVSMKDYPQYYQVVKNEINLKKMTQFCDATKYSSRDTFMQDMQLMRDNAALFNSATHDCTKAAEKLIEVVQSYFERDKDELVKLEEEIKSSSNEPARRTAAARSRGAAAGAARAKRPKKQRGTRKILKTVPAAPTPTYIGSIGGSGTPADSAGSLLSPNMNMLQSPGESFMATMNPFLDESEIRSPGGITPGPLGTPAATNTGTPGLMTAQMMGSPFVDFDKNNPTPGTDAFFGTAIGLTPGAGGITPGGALETPSANLEDEFMDFDDFEEDEGMEEIIEEESGVVEEEGEV